MTELRIASKPLILLTLRSYELNLFYVKISLQSEDDPVRVADLNSQSEHLQLMIAHSNRVLKNLED